MSIPDPILNTRAPIPVREQLALLAHELNLQPGTLHREILIEALVTKKVLATLKTVGFVETMRRLSTPTYAAHGDERTNTYDELLEQTFQKDVLPAGRETGSVKQMKTVGI